MNPKCLVFDFDYTLAFFRDGLGFLELFVSAGMRRQEVDSLFTEIVQSPEGFTIRRMLDAASSVDSFDQRERLRIAYAFRIWLERSLELYPDVLRCIEWALTAGIPWVIVTAGDDSYQRQKISALGLAGLVPADVFVTPPAHGKAEALRELIARFGRPIWFVDDSPHELDRVRAAGLSQDDVATFLLVRSDSLYTQVSPRHPHTSITSLDELRGREGVSHAHSGS